MLPTVRYRTLCRRRRRRRRTMHTSSRVCVKLKSDGEWGGVHASSRAEKIDESVGLENRPRVRRTRRARRIATTVGTRKEKRLAGSLTRAGGAAAQARAAGPPPAPLRRHHRAGCHCAPLSHRSPPSTLCPCPASRDRRPAATHPHHSKITILSLLRFFYGNREQQREFGGCDGVK